MTSSSFLKANFKPIYCILYGQRKDTWLKTRYCCSALTGAVSAWLLCKCILKSFLIPKKYEKSMVLLTISIAGMYRREKTNGALLLVLILLVSGFVFTDAVKCISLLIFLSLFGRSGSSYMRALTFAFVICGPIENLSSNTGEIVRAFSCSKILAINLTRTRFDLMTKPFQKTLVYMKEDIRDVQITFNQLRNVTKDLRDEVMLEDPAENVNVSNTDITAYRNRQAGQELNAEYIEEIYKNKFKMRCFKQLQNGKMRCRNAFSNALKKCYDKMPFIIRTLICWPFKVDFLCNIDILGNPEKICDSSNAVADNFGQTYVELVATENKLNKDSSNVKVNYTILSSEEIPGIKTAEETAKTVANKFKIRKQIFDSISKILKQLLGLMILKILCGMYI